MHYVKDYRHNQRNPQKQCHRERLGEFRALRVMVRSLLKEA
jgi:hypothetical protein